MNVRQPIENKTTRLHNALYRLFGSSINKRRHIYIGYVFGMILGLTLTRERQKKKGFMSEHIVVPIHRLDQEEKMLPRPRLDGRNTNFEYISELTSLPFHQLFMLPHEKSVNIIKARQD